MRLIFIAISVLLITSFSNGQTADTLNRTDANNLKQGYWIKNDTKTNTISEEGYYADDKKVGLWKKYYPEGKIKSEITYVLGKPDGYARFYYQNGNVSEEGHWKGNKWIGDYKYYHENGNPAYEWVYNDGGKRTGVQKYYYESGKIMIEGEWKDGKEAGVITEYYESGKVKSKKSFNNGKLDETSVKTYPAHESGNQHEASNNNTNNTETTENNTEPVVEFNGEGYHKLYKNGKLEYDGTWKNFVFVEGKRYFYENGKLTMIKVYRDERVIDIIYKN